jgi:hypothetical protein
MLYRAYLLNPGGHIYWVKIIDCTDDQDAVQTAKQFIDGCDVEVWDRDRLIGRVGPADLPH